MLVQKQKRLKISETSSTAGMAGPITSVASTPQARVSSQRRGSSQPQNEGKKGRKGREPKLARIAKDWGVDTDWLSTKFGDDILQTVRFKNELHRFIKEHPTMPAQVAFEHFRRRRDLRRSGKLIMTGPKTSNLWQAADLCLDEEDDETSTSTTAPTAGRPVSAVPRSSSAARHSATAPAPLPVETRDTGSMLSKLATAWPSSMSSASSMSNRVVPNSSPQQASLTNTPTTSPQSVMAPITTSVSLEKTTAHTIPAVEIPMTEAEAAGTLFSPMTTGGLDQFKQVQRAVAVILGKTPPLHIIQVAVYRLRVSKDSTKCIDDDPGYRAWVDANF